MIDRSLFWLRRTAASVRLLRSVERDLRTLGLTKTLDTRRSQPLGATPPVDPTAHAHRQALIVRRLARVVPGNTSCLRQSLTTQQLLAGDGIAATVRIGIEREAPGDYRMHAWLMLDGSPVLDTAASLEGYRITHELS